MSQESLQKQTVISREVMKCLFVLLPAGVLLSSLRLRVTYVVLPPHLVNFASRMLHSSVVTPVSARGKKKHFEPL